MSSPSGLAQECMLKSTLAAISAIQATHIAGLEALKTNGLSVSSSRRAVVVVNDDRFEDADVDGRFDDADEEDELEIEQVVVSGTSMNKRKGVERAVHAEEVADDPAEVNATQYAPGLEDAQNGQELRASVPTDPPLDDEEAIPEPSQVLVVADEPLDELDIELLNLSDKHKDIDLPRNPAAAPQAPQPPHGSVSPFRTLKHASPDPDDEAPQLNADEDEPQSHSRPKRLKHLKQRVYKDIPKDSGERRSREENSPLSSLDRASPDAYDAEAELDADEDQPQLPRLPKTAVRRLEDDDQAHEHGSNDDQDSTYNPKRTQKKKIKKGKKKAKSKAKAQPLQFGELDLSSSPRPVLFPEDTPVELLDDPINGGAEAINHPVPNSTRRTAIPRVQKPRAQKKKLRRFSEKLWEYKKLDPISQSKDYRIPSYCDGFTAKEAMPTGRVMPVYTSRQRLPTRSRRTLPRMGELTLSGSRSVVGTQRPEPSRAHKKTETLTLRDIVRRPVSAQKLVGKRGLLNKSEQLDNSKLPKRLNASGSVDDSRHLYNPHQVGSPAHPISVENPDQSGNDEQADDAEPYNDPEQPEQHEEVGSPTNLNDPRPVDNLEHPDHQEQLDHAAPLVNPQKPDELDNLEPVEIPESISKPVDFSTEPFDNGPLPDSLELLDDEELLDDQELHVDQELGDDQELYDDPESPDNQEPLHTRESSKEDSKQEKVIVNQGKDIADRSVSDNPRPASIKLISPSKKKLKRSVTWNMEIEVMRELMLVSAPRRPRADTDSEDSDESDQESSELESEGSDNSQRDIDSEESSEAESEENQETNDAESEHEETGNDRSSDQDSAMAEDKSDDEDGEMLLESHTIRSVEPLAPPHDFMFDEDIFDEEISDSDGDPMEVDRDEFIDFPEITEVAHKNPNCPDHSLPQGVGAHVCDHTNRIHNNAPLGLDIQRTISKEIVWRPRPPIRTNKSIEVDEDILDSSSPVQLRPRTAHLQHPGNFDATSETETREPSPEIPDSQDAVNLLPGPESFFQLENISNYFSRASQALASGSTLSSGLKRSKSLPRQPPLSLDSSDLSGDDDEDVPRGGSGFLSASQMFRRTLSSLPSNPSQVPRERDDSQMSWRPECGSSTSNMEVSRLRSGEHAGSSGSNDLRSLTSRANAEFGTVSARRTTRLRRTPSGFVPPVRDL